MAKKKKSTPKSLGAKAKAKSSGFGAAPIVAPGSPNKFRARVRMYRQGLGDCFLITFRQGSKPFHVLVDCGVLVGTADTMKKVVAHASQDHGITEVTPELAARVKSAIRDHVHEK